MISYRSFFFLRNDILWWTFHHILTLWFGPDCSLPPYGWVQELTFWVHSVIGKSFDDHFNEVTLWFGRNCSLADGQVF
ncbi:hypothetical protein HanRHA438_Chr15g0727321 [Helianthus annuus]|nr:hypothetical protein HanIR_Chr15g0777921 [Helianthus annuus]KAJ0846649.1 hypothetical protein HanRHA438_Chr15g0727321 [Helianthus annuus]